MSLWSPWGFSIIAMKSNNGNLIERRGYAPVNGLRMYYEIRGDGEPLVYIPPALGAIGMNPFPTLQRNRKVISMDLQGHGRTADIPERPLTIEQHAYDVIGLLEHLGVVRGDFFGESFGGATATMIAMQRPAMVNRLITYGATFGKPEDSLRLELFNIPPDISAEGKTFQFQRETYKKVAPNPDYWSTLLKKVFDLQWNGFPRERLASIETPMLIIQGGHDFVRIEHSVATYKLIPNAELAIIPDASHFVMYSEPQKVIPAIEAFLNEPSLKVPFGTPATGFRPGETR